MIFAPLPFFYNWLFEYFEYIQCFKNTSFKNKYQQRKENSLK